MQEDVGLKVVTDGEARRAFWHFDFMGMLDGMEMQTGDEGVQFHGRFIASHPLPTCVHATPHTMQRGNAFDIEVMVFVLTWAIVGGTQTFYGPILGCIVLTVLNEIVLREMGLEQARPLIYGAIMILSILFLPDGLESLVQKFTRHKSDASKEKAAA